jgi:hypothetical protein
VKETSIYIQKYRALLDSILGLEFFVLDIEDGLNDVKERHAALKRRIAHPKSPVITKADEFAAGTVARIRARGDINKLRHTLHEYQRVKPNSKTLTLNMCLVFIVALFEAFVVDVFTNVLISNVQMLKCARTLTFETVIGLGSQSRIIRHMAEKEMNEYAYASLTEQCRIYRKRFGVDIEESGVSIEMLAEIVAQRNLLIHNKGVVNKRYIESLRNPKLKLGAKVRITQEDWDQYVASFESAAGFIALSLAKGRDAALARMRKLKAEGAEHAPS